MWCVSNVVYSSITIFSKHLNKLISNGNGWLTNPGYPDWTSSWGCPCRVLVRGERSEDWCGAGLVWGGWRWSDATLGPGSTLGPGNNKTCDKPLGHFCMITLCYVNVSQPRKCYHLSARWHFLSSNNEMSTNRAHTHTHTTKLEWNIVL